MISLPQHNVSTAISPAKASLAVISPQSLLQSFAEPRGKLCLLYGDRAVFSLAHRIGAQSALTGDPVTIIDAANRFDVQAVVRYAREYKVDPDTLLNRLFISRGFTCYQVEAAIVERLPAFMKKINGHTACIFGLLDTFYDEAAKLRDVQTILHRIIQSLTQMRDEGFSILLVSTEWNVLPKERNNLFTEVKNAVDQIYRLDVGPEKKAHLYSENLLTKDIKRAIGRGKNG